MSFLYVVDCLLLSPGPSLPSGDARAWPGFDTRRLRKPHLPTLRLSPAWCGEHHLVLQRGSWELVAVTWLPESPVVGPRVE